MGTSNGELTTLWRDIDGLLARAREARPLRHADALLDVARLEADRGDLSLLTRLAEALAGWDGRLLVPAPDDALAPAIERGDGLVVDTETEAQGGNLVVAFRDSGLLVRYLTWRDARQWFVAAGCAAIPLGPEVAILGIVLEVRRAVAIHAEYRYGA